LCRSGQPPGPRARGDTTSRRGVGNAAGPQPAHGTIPTATAGSSRNAPVARDGRRFTGGSRGNPRGAADAFACQDAGG
jgi:hypothetical protein